jgi:hypothetical protein
MPPGKRATYSAIAAAVSRAGSTVTSAARTPAASSPEQLEALRPGSPSCSGQTSGQCV